MDFDNSRNCNGSVTAPGFEALGCLETISLQTAVQVRTNTAMFGLAYEFD